jgi:transposase
VPKIAEALQIPEERTEAATAIRSLIERITLTPERSAVRSKFCRLGLDGAVPDHSTFSKNRHGRFRDSDLLRQVFETVVARCMTEGLVGGEAFAVDASMVVADARARPCRRE